MSSITFSPGTIISKEWLNDLNTVAFTYFGDGTNLNSPTKLTIASVVTPLVNSTGSSLVFQIGGVSRWQVDTSQPGLTPNNDNTDDLGRPALRIRTVFSPIIDSGSGNLLFKLAGTTALTLSTTSAQFVKSLDVQSTESLFLCDNVSAGAKLFIRKGRDIGAGSVDAVGLDALNSAVSTAVPMVIRASILSLLGSSGLRFAMAPQSGNGIAIDGTLAQANNPTGLSISPNLSADGSSTVGSFIIDCGNSTITLAAASFTLSETGTLRLAPPTYSIGGGAVVGNASTLEITAAPASGTTKRALWVKAGITHLDGGVVSNAQTSIPAGGTAGVGVMVSSTANFGIFFGSGAPSLSAAKGSLYLRSDGTTTNNRAYINTDGGTTWTAVTTVA